MRMYTTEIGCTGFTVEEVEERIEEMGIEDMPDDFLDRVVDELETFDRLWDAIQEAGWQCIEDAIYEVQCEVESEKED